MKLEEPVYSALIVSGAEKFNTGLMEMMPAAGFDKIKTAASISAARREVAERSYDIVIINSPLGDDMGLNFAIDACDSEGTVVLDIVKADLYGDIYARLSPCGVFVASKPLSRQSMETALRWMVSARERVRKMEKKTVSIEEKMEEIRLVNRAKWLLIGELKMSEPEAHKYIEKQAMDRCVNKREIARGIINTYS